MSATTDWWTLGVIVGLAAVTVLTRCFFFILDRPWGLPEWAHRALHYAPAAALAGVIAPEIVMTQGRSRIKKKQRVSTVTAARPTITPSLSLIHI